MEQQENGPYLQAAFFCERLLEEADGVLSVIRIVDTVTVQSDGQTTQLEPGPVHLTLFIAFKAGQARGSYNLTVTMEPPSRITADEEERHTQSLVFYGTEDRGVTVIMPVAMAAVEEGVYWFGVYLDDRIFTRIPLRVAVAREMPLNDPQ